MIYPIKVIISGGGGGGGGSGDTLLLGTPSDGTYEDGAADLRPNMTIANGVDEINETLAYLLPDPPQPLSGNLSLSITRYTGYIANYSNLGSISPGSSFNNIITVNNFNGITPNSNKFAKADKGELRLYKNDSLIDTFDLEADFNEAEKEGCQSYPPKDSSNGYITVLSVCWYNNFPAYQKGQARVNFKPDIVDIGYNKFQLKHVINTEENSLNPLEIYYDDGPRPSISTFNINITSEQYKYLSGIKYLTSGTQFDISISANDIFNKTYTTYPITLSGDVINSINIRWDDSHASGFSNPPNWNDSWNYSNSMTFNRENAGENIVFRTTPRDPIGSGTTVTQSLNYLYNTYGIESTDTHEYFVDENYRLPQGNYDTIPSNITGQWDSTQALTNGNAQVYIDRLVYPTQNFNASGINPTQDPGRDYSSFSGDQLYFRAIKDDGTPHNSGNLHIRGITWSDVGTNVELYLKLPGKTGWLDLSKDYIAASFSGSDGDGCMVSHTQSGDVLSIEWTSGYFSTSESGYMYILKIVLKNNNCEILEIWDWE